MVLYTCDVFILLSKPLPLKWDDVYRTRHSVTLHTPEDIALAKAPGFQSRMTRL